MKFWEHRRASTTTRLILNNWRILAVSTAVGSVLSAAVSLCMPNLYTGRALVYLPPDQSLSSLLGGTGSALAQISGGMNPLKNPNDLYVGMLRSRNVVDGVIKSQNYKTPNDKSNDESREKLASVTKIVAGKDNMISIEVTDRIPKVAADLTNAYVANLKRLTAELGTSVAKERTAYLQSKVTEVSSSLAKAEDNLKAVQEKTGVTEVSLNAQADIASAAALDARIAGKEAEIAAMRQYSTDKNADMRRATSELESLKAGASHLKQPALSGIAGKGLEFVRAFREVKYQEAMYEVLSRQYEAARIDESKQISPLEVIDEAVVPDMKSGPKRSLITIFGALFATFLALSSIALRESLSKDSIEE